MKLGKASGSLLIAGQAVIGKDGKLDRVEWRRNKYQVFVAPARLGRRIKAAKGEVAQPW
jgi:hypothetical protein